MKQLFVLTALLCATSILFAQPLNDITNRRVVSEKRIIPWDMPDERDVFWQKTIWRIIDVREKINLPFTYPVAPFYEVLVNAARAGEINLYHPITDDFSSPMTEYDLNNSITRKDTVEIWTNDYEMELKIVETEVFYEDVKRFRIKEKWYFDSNDSQMKVRILGIAPLQEVYGEDGHFKYEKPLFWVHYPTSREMLAREQVFVESNEASRMTWEDLFEMRKFSSYITKEGNVRNNRLEDLYSGIDLLLESDKIKQDIFNYEHDLWTY